MITCKCMFYLFLCQVINIRKVVMWTVAWKSMRNSEHWKVFVKVLLIDCSLSKTCLTELPTFTWSMLDILYRIIRFLHRETVCMTFITFYWLESEKTSPFITHTLWFFGHGMHWPGELWQTLRLSRMLTVAQWAPSVSPSDNDCQPLSHGSGRGTVSWKWRTC